MTANTTLEGKKMVFTEKFESPFEKDTKAEALEVLDQIRAAYPFEAGWVEVIGYAEQLSNGKWRAVRTHQKYE